MESLIKKAQGLIDRYYDGDCGETVIETEMLLENAIDIIREFINNAKAE